MDESNDIGSIGDMTLAQARAAVEHGRRVAEAFGWSDLLATTQNAGVTVCPPRPVIVRTHSAGVHFGHMVSRNGQEVRLERSRRIWRWFGANTLSEIALAGLDTAKSRVAAPISVTLTQAIEIIDCMPAAVENLEGASWTE